jgi:hypothetical protein
MKSFIRMTLSCVLISLALSAALFTSCDTGSGSETASGYTYSTATAKVDYNGANRAVFFDFSTGTVTELAHDFFDIAIDATGKIIANSGSYGSGVKMYKTSSTTIADDFGANAALVKEYTFHAGVTILQEAHPSTTPYQAAADPFANEFANAIPSVGSGCVYLIKTAAGNYYKVIFNLFGMTGLGYNTGYTITVVPGLAAGETGKATLTASTLSGLSGPNGFGYIYFDLDDASGPKALNGSTALEPGAPAIPTAAEWDLLFTRTDELLEDPDHAGHMTASMGGVTGRSSVLINTYKNVEAAEAAGSSIDQVVNTTGLTFSDDVDAIGYKWYSMPSMGNFLLNTNTYVVKTAEGNYAKFQPGSFYGPASEQFYMQFRYYYSGSSSGTFND